MPKILLVDDGPFRKMRRITFAHLGYEVWEAADGRAANPPT